jgi:tRNA-modifying protein YgfZ
LPIVFEDPVVNPLSVPNLLQGVTPLPQWGVIRIEGDDAAKFIHGQLTHDFSLLGLNEARLAAFCTAKGRMLASFIGFKRSQGDILLLTSADLVAAMVKRLSMFVMRANAKVSDASAEFAVWGLSGPAVQTLAGTASQAWAKVDLGDASVVELYAVHGVRRQLFVAPDGHAAPAGSTLDPALWAWGEVQSAVATVGAPVSEAFVPQMLNYESLGGVNFKKGCYPGQEVVARSQFRGTLKRRAYLVHGDVQMHAGQSIFTPEDAEQPVATVVQSAPAPDGGFDAIISGQTSAIETGPLHLGSSTGSALALRTLPYGLLDDI